MEKEANCVIVLPGDKVILTADRPVKLYYWTVDVAASERELNIVL